MGGYSRDSPSAGTKENLMPPTHAGLADPRAYVRVATIVRQQIIDGTLEPGQAGAIDHPPQPGARARAADLQQGAAHAGKRRAC